MPQVKVDYIVSFSSEDPGSPASNLLSKDLAGVKWVGKEKGASSNSVILQLEKSCQITSIHVGNYHSGFIEVLAGRSEASDQQYEVLLITSSFMTPADSRNSLNITSVRTFTFDKLSTPAREKKWDRIRIVCTQPFNRHVQYGLTFCHLFSTDSNPSSIANPPAIKQSNILGKFKVKNDSDEEADTAFKPGELFARLRQNTNLSTDAQIRNASSPHNLTKDSSNLLVKAQRPVVKNDSPLNKTKANSVNPLSRKRDKIMYIDEDDEPNEKIDSIIKKDKEEKKNNEIKNAEIKTNPTLSNTNKDAVKKNTTLNKTSFSKDKPAESTKLQTQRTNDINVPSTSNNINGSQNLKRKVSPVHNIPDKKPCVVNINTPAKPNIIRGPDCFRDIVFVISGYANPRRSNLRDIAISMGAKYRPDWGGNCTHLICAFPNTPKHEQVLRTSRSAIVVTGEWIETCGKEKARLPWEWFATDPRKRIARPPDNQLSKDISNNNISKPNKILRNDPATDNEEEDTDDEIERIIEMQNNSQKLAQVKKVQTLKSEDSDITDIEEETNEISKKVSFNKVCDDSDTTDIEDEISKKDNPIEIADDSDKTDIEDEISKKNNPIEIADDSDKTDIEDEVYVKKLEKVHNSIKIENDSDSDKTDIEDADCNVGNKTVSNAFTLETDSDSDSKCKIEFEEDMELNELPDHFSGIKFYVDTNLTNESYDCGLLTRYITAYNGEVIDSWPNLQIDVAITSPTLVDNLRPDKGKKCQFLHPDWIWKCNDANILYPFEEYLIK